MTTRHIGRTPSPGRFSHSSHGGGNGVNNAATGIMPRSRSPSPRRGHGNTIGISSKNASVPSIETRRVVDELLNNDERQGSAVREQAHQIQILRRKVHTCLQANDTWITECKRLERIIDTLDHEKKILVGQLRRHEIHSSQMAAIRIQMESAVRALTSENVRLKHENSLANSMIYRLRMSAISPTTTVPPSHSHNMTRSAPMFLPGSSEYMSIPAPPVFNPFYHPYAGVASGGSGNTGNTGNTVNTVNTVSSPHNVVGSSSAPYHTQSSIPPGYGGRSTLGPTSHHHMSYSHPHGTMVPPYSGVNGSPTMMTTTPPHPNGGMMMPSNTGMPMMPSTGMPMMPYPNIATPSHPHPHMVPLEGGGAGRHYGPKVQLLAGRTAPFAATHNVPVGAIVAGKTAGTWYKSTESSTGVRKWTKMKEDDVARAMTNYGGAKKMKFRVDGDRGDRWIDVEVLYFPE